MVDDEPDVVELIRFHLEAQGHQVITAFNGFDAIAQVRRRTPDLVILDVMMEGVDGLSVCEILRAQPATRGTPVIIVTAAVGEMAKLNSYAAGATDFVTKPFSPQELVKKAGRLLDATLRRSNPGTM